MTIDSGTVLILITLIVVPIAGVAFARSGAAWSRIGKGAFAIEQEIPTKRPAEPAKVDPAMQAAEARQMLEARSYRRQRAGGEPLDVEAELARVLETAATPAPADAALREEVRGLVIAGNERRMRRGEDPLDVEAETQRQLDEIA